ncbi:MAG TPA: tetratricopeptide repeat protein [Pyrinomonadaceae bacterium]|nr:tetratricopeptide repeat protein [Chloracidobacterium sp.]MBP9934783.1 tetratricopeptide repeat protein [Pyrinomonadaceae bacterium]MBK9438168.1 tetratricopeptide repeat protein [Chloracidobacterium sp.]MBL0240956.1 tetratricopeptide repeat protein [Chloracidobacterium sp.]HQX56767.1 tetratricopeptide repeat protein [Pyrinomonadaceae bacterium]
MKRCPECRRDYYDDTLLYCLDDGNALLEGPASGSGTGDEPATAILSEPGAIATGFRGGEDHTRQFVHTTDETAILQTGAVAEPQKNLGDAVEKQQSFSANRATKPLALLVVAVLILVGGFFGYRYFQPAGSGTINSIAVLPFENRSGNADTDYLSDGLAESLIYKLSQLSGLKVSPTSSVVKYKGSQTDISAISKELEVDAVMSGRVTQRGDDLTISVELIDARTKKLIWAEQYDRKLADLLATQREIAATVVQKLQLQLSGDQTKGLAKQYTNNSEAYQLYLKGRFYSNKRTPAGMKAAIEQFKAAAEKDPNFALAFAGLADAYYLTQVVGDTTAAAQQKETTAMARTYLDRALALDPYLAEAHATLGNIISSTEGKWAEAESSFKRSIELNPSYPSAHHYYSRLLRRQGRFDEALDEAIKAKQLDELSAGISNNLAEALYEKGDIEAAIAEANRGLGLAPFWRQYRTLAHCYLRVGKTDEALANARKAYEVNGAPNTLSVIGYVQAVAGNRAEAQAILSQLENSFAKGDKDGTSSASGTSVATVYAGLGETDRVFEWLEKDFQANRYGNIWGLRTSPQFVPLRGDPRFKDLMRRVGLPE